MSRFENVARCPEIDPVFVNWSDSSLGDPRLTQTIAGVAAVSGT
jgi:hypothetical protein